MNAIQFLNSLAVQGFTIAADADSLVVKGPTVRLTDADRQAIRQHKPELLRLLTRQKHAEPYEAAERAAIQQEHELHYVPLTAGELYEAVWLEWESIEDSDRQYMATSPDVRPCGYCGGRKTHHSECYGRPRMPWGKHRNTPLTEIPERYLRFVLQQRIGTAEHRRAILNDLQRRNGDYYSPEWGQYVSLDELWYDPKQAQDDPIDAD